MTYESFGLGGWLRWGVLLAAAGIRPFVTFWPGSLPRAEEIRLDWRVLLFAVAISLACGLLFGLAPALRVPTGHLERVLRAGSRTVSGSAQRWHGAFVIAETDDSHVAYLDHIADGVTTDSPAIVGQVSTRFDVLRTEAYKGTESLKMIEAAAESWNSA